MRCSVLFLFVCWASAETRVYMERSGLSDMETSASGYMYHSASGQPTSFVQISNGAHFPAVPVARYVQAYPAQARPAQPAYVAQPEASANLEQGEKYEKEGGQEYAAAHRSAHGEKGDEGYKNRHEFSKGNKGSHENEHHEGNYANAGGEKEGHHASDGQYKEHHEAGKGSEGESYGNSEYHKKGQKTSGFHKVYHKDEFKKDHTFYDESDKSGHFEKHGDHNSNHGSEEGAFKKGGSHHSGHHGGHYGNKGYHDKGRYNKQDEGFKGQQGKDGYYSNQSEYANEEGKNGESEHGYREDGKYYD